MVQGLGSLVSGCFCFWNKVNNHLLCFEHQLTTSKHTKHGQNYKKAFNNLSLWTQDLEIWCKEELLSKYSVDVQGGLYFYGKKAPMLEFLLFVRFLVMKIYYFSKSFVIFSIQTNHNILLNKESSSIIAQFTDTW